MNPAPPKSDVLVVGAGLAGLSAALELGGRYRLVERASRPGGLCRTEARDGFLFDSTGHWLHLRDPGIRALVEELLPGGWVSVERRAAVRSHGAFTPYPYQVRPHPNEAAFRERLRLPLPVPTTAVYSRTDGIASWRSCVADPGPHSESIEVESSHLGIGHHPVVLLTLADRLAQAEGAWTPFRPPAGWRWPFVPAPRPQPAVD